MDKTKQDLCYPAFPKFLGQLSVDEIICYYICENRLFQEGDKSDPLFVPNNLKDWGPIHHLESLGLVIQRSCGGYRGSLISNKYN